MHPAQTDISARVRAQYEAFPYPHYPILLPLSTQEAYASHSLFAARLLEQDGEPALRRNGAARVLLAGCGDIFPYMASAWEPRAHGITAVDLSGRSLRRARLRCLPRLRPIEWRQGNLEDPGFALPEDLAHIDCYGVLHHLADPARTLRRFGGLLLPGGTLRIMVYNSEARSWIRHVQRAFTLLGLSANREDPDIARRLLERLIAVSPSLRERLASMGDALANPSRLVDTFLHAREARLGLRFWLGAAADAGLRVMGAYDRYAELDDLPNPLLQPPGAEAWLERIADRRFENNLELYLAKAGRPGPGARVTCKIPTRQLLKSPPRSWSAYPETQGMPFPALWSLWRHFLGRLEGRDAGFLDAWAGKVPPAALQRLSRLGAALPDDFRSRELRALLRHPIHDSMEPPEPFVPGPVFQDSVLREEATSVLRGKGRPPGYLENVMKRLDAAQGA
jgi:SAM-dependent methyltransferase